MQHAPTSLSRMWLQVPGLNGCSRSEDTQLLSTWNSFFYSKNVIVEYRILWACLKKKIRGRGKENRSCHLLGRWEKGLLFFLKLLTRCHTVNTKANGNRSHHSNKTLVSERLFPRSGDYVLQVAENRASLYSTSEYFNLHFAVREKAKLGRETMRKIAFVLLWGGWWSIAIGATIIPQPSFPQKRNKG